MFIGFVRKNSRFTLLILLLIVNKMLLILVISIIMAMVQLKLRMAIGILEAQPELPKTYKMVHFATIDNGF